MQLFNEIKALLCLETGQISTQFNSLENVNRIKKKE